jgi:1-piperideine-2-carboxylate/1-pyrroline-2-carboxylate reductase [NAD(P)H]
MSPQDTAAALPYWLLTRSIESLLKDKGVVVPARIVQALPGGGSLFVMPAHDAKIAMTKLITFTPRNAGSGRATIQGDIVVFEIASGRRIYILDGPTVTARRTAAVSLLAAQSLTALRPRPKAIGPLLIVGAGVQGHAHLEAFREGLGLEEVWVHSRSESSANRLIARALALGMRAKQVEDPNAAMAHCPFIISTTPAQKVVLTSYPREDAFIAAVGAFTPKMVEWDPSICRRIAQEGQVFVDTRDADHEAGDLLQAGLDVHQFSCLGDIIGNPASTRTFSAEGPIFFKSCGWAGWDLAAARCVFEGSSQAISPE